MPQLGWRAQYNPKDKANMGAIYQNLMAWLAGAELAESEASED